MNLSVIFSLIILSLISCHVEANSLEFQYKLYPREDLFETGNKSNAALMPKDSNGCKCMNMNCGCCVNFDAHEKSHHSEIVCVNVTYLPDQIGVSLLVSFNGKVYYNKTVSVKNPPAMCVAVPYLKKLASVCIKFYNLDIKNKQLSGCLKLLAKFFFTDIETIKLGCFKIPPGVNGPSNKVGVHSIPWVALTEANRKEPNTQEQDTVIDLLFNVIKKAAYNADNLPSYKVRMSKP